MTTLLIVNSNSPELIEAAAARGEPDLGWLYGAAFQQIDPAIRFQTTAPYRGDALVLDGIDGVAFTGSSVEWNTGDNRAAPLAQCMEQVFASALPVFGSCNGTQLAASVLGGEVAASPNGREIGPARQIKLTLAGRDHPMMAGRKDRFSVLCSHRDEVRRLPKGAVLLAGNAHSAVQAFAYDAGGVDFWGSLYHPELSGQQAADNLAREGGADAEIIAELRLVETDEAAAARLGTSVSDMSPCVRMTEMRNWLKHVRNVVEND